MKNKFLLIMLIFALAFTFTSCEDEGEEMSTATAESFLSAVEAGDFETAESYCTPEAYKATGLEDLAKVDKTFCKALKQKRKNLSKKARGSLDDLKAMFMTDFIKNYEITSIEESKTGYVVMANVSYGFDMDKLAGIKLSEKAINKITEGYLDEHQEELLKIYKEQGDDMMMAKIISDLMPKFVDKYKDKVKDTGSVDDVIQLCIEKKKNRYVIVDASMRGLEAK